LESICAGGIINQMSRIPGKIFWSRFT